MSNYFTLMHNSISSGTSKRSEQLFHWIYFEIQVGAKHGLLKVCLFLLWLLKQSFGKLEKKILTH